MKRTAILQRSPMKRSGAIARTLSVSIIKSRLKTKGPKATPIRRAARGQDCTLTIPGVCNGNPETTVLCHSNALADGKGMGLKAPDTAAAFGCSSCHDVLDGRRPRPGGLTKTDMDEIFYAGMLLTHAMLRACGLMPCVSAKETTR